LGNSRDRACQTPSHNQKRNRGNDQYLDRHVQESTTPNAQYFSADVGGVMDNYKASDKCLIRCIKRSGKHVDLPESHAQECALGAMVLKRVR
jgi:hypothetical protein